MKRNFILNACPLLVAAAPPCNSRLLPCPAPPWPCRDGLAVALGQRLVVLNLFNLGSAASNGGNAAVEFVSAVDAPETVTALAWLAAGAQSAGGCASSGGGGRPRGAGAASGSARAVGAMPQARPPALAPSLSSQLPS